MPCSSTLVGGRARLGSSTKPVTTTGVVSWMLPALGRAVGGEGRAGRLTRADDNRCARCTSGNTSGGSYKEKELLLHSLDRIGYQGLYLGRTVQVHRFVLQRRAQPRLRGARGRVAGMGVEGGA